ncbi:MAG: phosphoserine phosphatase SerB [Rhodospirillaceae bacterium]
MDAVLTLIAGPGTGIEAGLVEAVRDALASVGIAAARPVWLAPGQACDIEFQGSPDQAEAAAALVVNGAAVDLVAQRSLDRRKRLLISDMESTIIRQELLDELGRLAGVGPAVADITRRAMAGELDFVDAIRTRVAMLEGLPVTALEEVAAGIELMPGALALVRTMRQAGAWCMLVSGGFRVFTSRVARQVGFDAETGSQLETYGGKLTGRMIEPILDPDGKANILVRTVVARRTPLRATVAVGDGANDLPMLEIAGLGVAYHASPRVAGMARARLDHADLTGLLYAQGYRQSEIIFGESP